MRPRRELAKDHAIAFDKKFHTKDSSAFRARNFVGDLLRHALCGLDERG